ncbi:MAG: HU family DNA-binding protein [Bacteroidales bacterium]|jgi:nucleoid DNA-binding protein|nr:HU family DNA-binding protein [Bacteroidales bacterium]
MKQNELIRSLASRLGLTQVETKRLLKSSVEIIVDVLDQDIPISLPNLGSFCTVITKKRKSFSPFHKEYVMLAPKRIIRFRPSSSIKNELKTKKV